MRDEVIALLYLLSTIPMLLLIYYFNIIIRNRYLPEPVNKRYVFDDNKLCEFWNEKKSLFYIILVIDIVILIIIFISMVYYNVSEIDTDEDVFLPFFNWVVITILFLYCSYMPWKACKIVEMNDSTPNGNNSDDEEDTY